MNRLEKKKLFLAISIFLLVNLLLVFIDEEDKCIFYSILMISLLGLSIFLYRRYRRKSKLLAWFLSASIIILFIFILNFLISLSISASAI
jgi:predicted membrane protein